MLVVVGVLSLRTVYTVQYSFITTLQLNSRTANVHAGKQ